MLLLLLLKVDRLPGVSEAPFEFIAPPEVQSLRTESKSESFMDGINGFMWLLVMVQLALESMVTSSISL